MISLIRKVSWWLQRRRKEADLREELEFHLAEEASARQADGLPPAEASWAARRDLGNVTLVRENVRGLWSWALIDQLVQDVQFAVRGMRRSPGFAFTVIMIAGVGIGANVSVFSLLDAVLLRPLPFHEPSRLVEIWGRDAQRTGLRVPLTLVDTLRERATTLESVAVHGPDGGDLRTADGPVRIVGRRVSANYFDVLGNGPLVGRTLRLEDETIGAPAVAVVSHGFWQQRMGGDPTAVGHTIYVGATPFVVVGVMPADFRTSFRLRPEDFWTPHVREPIRQLEKQAGQELIGRLAQGATIDEARRELRAISASVGVDGWGSNGRRLDLVPLVDEVVGDSAYALELVALAVAVLLMIVCANVALLSLARSDRRVTEFATRKAIGATATQLMRFALIESVLLAVVGGLIGIALSYWLIPALRALAPLEIPRLLEARVDGRVLTVAFVLSVATGVVFGLVPALRLSRIPVIDVIKRGAGPGPRYRARFRSGLVIAQVAATVALLVLAGLVGRSFWALLPSDPGFEPRFRSVFGVVLPTTDQAARARTLRQLVDQVRTLPDVQGAALGSNVPFGGDDGFRRVAVVDGTEYKADLRAVTENYFDLLEMPLVAGRGFGGESGSSVGAAIVNQTFARRLEGNVIGRRLQINSATAPLPTYEIVGIVTDARSSGATTGIWDEVYIPVAQSNPSIVVVIVASAKNPETLDPLVRRELRTAIPGYVDDPFIRLTPMASLVDQSLARPRFSATLVSIFAAAALVLAAMGVFGLIAYSVALRRQELGLRAALGADARRLLLMVLRSTVGLVALGVAVGLGAAGYLMRFLASQLYEVEAIDLPTFVGAAFVMLAVGCAAALLPAFRAARVDPMVALRCE